VPAFSPAGTFSRLGPGLARSLDPACAHGQVLGSPASLEAGQPSFGQPADDHRDMGGPLADPGRPASRPGPPTLGGRALVYITGGHEQLFGVEAVVIRGVGHR